MIISFKKRRKAVAPQVAKRAGYLDRSSFEEDLRSSQWARVEQVMQSLGVSWLQAQRIMSLSGERRGVR